MTHQKPAAVEADTRRGEPTFGSQFAARSSQLLLDRELRSANWRSTGPAGAGFFIIWRILPAISWLVLLAACAKTGDPHPPTLRIPKASVDLAARQFSDEILLTVSMPTQNTNGSPVTTLAEVELFRRTEDRQRDAEPLSEEEFLNGAEKILSISIEDIAKYLHDGTLSFRDKPSLPDPQAAYRLAFRYAVRFVNEKYQTAGLGNRVWIAPVAIPRAPQALTFKLSQDLVRLSWQAPLENSDGSRPPRVAGYNLYRSESPDKLPSALLNRELLAKLEFEDRNFEFDKTYYYAVSVVGSKENPYAESSPSAELAVPARDTFPPGAPLNLNAVVEGGAVLLLWVAPPENDVAGYRIYRRQRGSEEAKLLEVELIKLLSYRDDKVQQGNKYDYRVTAVDTHGNEGPAAVTSAEIQ